MNDEAECAKLINSALSPDPKIRLPAEETLRSCEGKQGFAFLLLCVGTAYGEYPENVRILSVILLKNVVHRTWNLNRRQSSSGIGSQFRGISHEEKNLLKIKLIETFADPSKQVATQLRLIIAKIARTDWPKDWSNLFDILLPYLKDSHRNILLVRRSAHLFLAIIKELSTKRLLGGKKNFIALTRVLFPEIKSLWDFYVDSLCSINVENLDEQNEIGRVYAELVLRFTKVLRAFLLYGLSTLDSQNLVLAQTFEKMVYLQKHLRTVILKNNGEDIHEIQNDIPFLSKSIHKCSKAIMICLVDLQKGNPVGFLPFLKPFLLQTYQAILDYKEEERDAPWLILSLLFVANIIDCPEYQEANTLHSRVDGKLITAKGDITVESNKIFVAASNQVDTFFNVDRIHQLCTVLVCRLLCASNKDLARWNEDPEHFVVTTEFLTKEESIGPAAENLLLSLSDRNENMVSNVLYDFLRNHEEHLPISLFCSESFLGGNDPYSKQGCFICGLRKICQCQKTNELPRAVVVRDSIYIIAGLISYRLHNFLCFNQWLTMSLVAFLEPTHFPLNEKANWSWMLLQKRVLWLLRCWISELSQESYQQLFEAILRIIRTPSINLVIRIEAVNTVKTFLSSDNVDPVVFIDNQSNLIGGIYALLHSCETSEGKLILIDTIRGLIKKSGESIVTCVESLTSEIPKLWVGGGDTEETMWRSAILSLLTNLVEATGLTSSKMQQLVDTLLLPLVEHTTSTQNPENFSYFEDAAKLWSAIVLATPIYSATIHSMFLRVPDILVESSHDTQQIENILQIVEAYILIGGEVLIISEAHRRCINQVFAHIIGKSKERIEICAAYVLEVIIAKFPKSSVLLAEETFQYLLKICATLSPSGEGESVFVAYLSTLAKLYVQKRQHFVLLLENHTSDVSNREVIFCQLVKWWIQLFPIAGESPGGTSRQKIWSVCLCQSFSSRCEEILRISFNAILSIWIQTYERIGNKTITDVPPQIFRLESSKSTALYAKLRHELFQTDALSQVSMLKVMSESLQACRNAIGNTNFQQLLASSSNSRRVFEILQNQQSNLD